MHNSPRPARTRTPVLRPGVRHALHAPRGARLARRLVSHRLHEWGHPYNTTANDTVTLIAAELAANAVRHGHVPGRDFHLRLTIDADADATTIRIEATDTRTERVPALASPAPDAEAGRGLLLVAALATRWGTTSRIATPGKTVWAQLVVSDRVQNVARVTN
ncbi:ATP-binding protein [Streptomyces sp. CS149]|uniref:ATP-binding protein n=1 Tax=Streptomyces sp. CS149 TaxID=2109332 RepID=UPI000D1BACB4|nr:ATP-binding protein [Streptomyces sp. CS149]PSK69009.1 ATP-binding protein [Streptomyces sp. CS149]